MSRPTTRKGTANLTFRRRIPADVKRILDGLPAHYRPKGWGQNEIVISLRTADRRRAGAEHARIAAEVEERLARFRQGPSHLTWKQAVALSGTVYRAVTESMGEEPGARGMWNWHGPSLPGYDRLVAGIAANVLANEGLVVDEDSMAAVVRATGQAFDDARSRLARNAEGDYRPDPAAERFPEWTPDAPKAPVEGKKKLTLIELFDAWAGHPEQAQQARGTLKRYRSVFTAVSTFLNNPDARAVTTDDLQRYVEARMAGEGAAKLQPRVARGVHKAALSSVYGWSQGKRTVPSNPAEGVRIKVVGAKRLRSKGANDEEAQALVQAALAVSQTAVAGSLDAAKRWCSMLALYTGCRIGEATQLRKEDFVVANGTQVIRITPEAGDVKDREVRLVPIHARLIELGLAEFVASAPAGPLFYQERPSTKAAASTRYELRARDLAAWVRQVAMTDPLLLKPLHSLRHRFVSLCRRAGIEDQYMKAITGHALGRVVDGYGEFDVPALVREIAKLRPEDVEGRGSAAVEHEATA